MIKMFIKDSEDTTNPKVRQNYGMFSGIVGIICNLILFCTKFFAGIITASISISADAFNNLSDAGSSIVTLIGFKLAGKPADSGHPFGHGRIEYLSGVIVSFAIIIMGYELFKSSISKIVHPEQMYFSIVSIFILVGSILLKLWMAVFNTKIGKKISSTSMGATAADSLTDCVATSAVLISLIISTSTGFNIDGYAGILVAGFVFMTGIGTAKDTLQPLLGKPADKEFVDAIQETICSHKEIIGVHDLIVHDYGPGRVFVTLHAEIPYEMNVLEAHDIIDLTEKEIAMEYNCEISIHMDPIVTDDETVTELKKMTESILKEIDPVITMHDFRITEGPYIKNLIFDIQIPYGYKQEDEELVKMIKDEISRRKENCFAVIHVDKSFVAE
jgi:cation diffusion facilitator family transporter